jgi:enoyl-CoA hydratase/carnithine racemase
MPDTGRGWIVDGGASHSLPRLKGQLGMYLALTGAELRAYDLIHAGIATHCYTRAAIRAMEWRAQDSYGLHHTGQILIDSTSEPIDKMEERLFTLASEWDLIDECFGQQSVEEIMAALQRRDSAFAKKTLAQLSSKSPLSLKVAFRQIRQGKLMSLDECLRQEYRLALNILESQDFRSAVSAQQSQTNTESVQWQHKSVSQVKESDVDKLFTLPAGERELVLEGLDDKKPAERKWWGEVVYPHIPAETHNAPTWHNEWRLTVRPDNVYPKRASDRSSKSGSKAASA